MKTILFFGLIRPYKGLELLIEAVRDLDVKLLVVGEVWEDDTIIEKLTNNPKIEFIRGYVDDIRIPAYFNRADVLVLPYLRASSSGVAHIGMSFGLPIVYTDVGGLRESMRGYEGGICVKDPKRLRMVIRTALILSEYAPFPIPKGMTFKELANEWDVVNPTIIGPSHRFESGISHYTVSLSNSLRDPNVILFRNMLPKFLFPGKDRVGNAHTTHIFTGCWIELLDWYNPFTWIRAGGYLNHDVILEWWTSSVAHMYLFIMLFYRRNYIIEMHETIDPMEHSNILLRTYSRIMGALIRRLASSYVVHSNADKVAINLYYNIPPDKIKVIPHGIYDYHKKNIIIEGE
jgi:glycosyltransferase involved in cell wall biosynthesis